jgi:hypothetical protein
MSDERVYYLQGVHSSARKMDYLHVDESDDESYSRLVDPRVLVLLLAQWCQSFNQSIRPAHLF